MNLQRLLNRFIRLTPGIPLLLTVLFLTVGSVHLSAQDARLDSLQKELTTIEYTLDGISNSIKENIESTDSLERQSSKLIKLQNQIETSLEDLGRLQEEYRDRLEDIGPRPAEDEPKESDVVANLRIELEDKINIVSSTTQRLLELQATVNEHMATVAKQKKMLFFDQVSHRKESILSPTLWKNAIAEIPIVQDQLLLFLSTWKRGLLEKQNYRGSIFFMLIILIAVVVMLYFVFKNSIWKNIDDFFYQDGELTTLDKRRRAAVKSLSIFVLLTLAFLLLYWTGREFRLINEYNSIFFVRLFFSISATVFLIKFLRSILSPETGKWRLLEYNDFYSKRIVLVFSLIFIAFILERGPSTAVELIYELAVDLILVMIGVGSLVIHCLILYLTRRKIWVNTLKRKGPDGAGEPDIKLRYDIIRKTFRLAAFILIAANLIGYIRLSSFMAHRFVLLTFFVVFILTLRELLAWGILELQSAGSPKSVNENEDENDHKNSLLFWIRVIIDISLPVIFFPLLLLLLGFDQLDIERIYAFFNSNIHIGAVRFSMANLIYGFAVFFFTVILTRVISSGFENRILNKSHFDPGLRNSMMTLLNYVGILVAILISLSIIGIDFSKIALIAGALSVGIGFGLQSIVSNFVSGLILLFERPIKIGDWIIVNSGQGKVKHIGARATQIQTFDQSTIIIPNSELISSSLTNWFYNNRRGRITIAVGVAYDSDPEQVREVLMNAAKDHPSVLKTPSPMIYWADFADSSLNFEVRVHVRNIDEILHIQTDLRFAIFKGLKEAGITIPFPQRDVNFFPQGKNLREKQDHIDPNGPSADE